MIIPKASVRRPAGAEHGRVGRHTRPEYFRDTASLTPSGRFGGVGRVDELPRIQEPSALQIPVRRAVGEVRERGD